MGIENTEYTSQHGATKEFEGDVVVSDSPDSLGWTHESFDTDFEKVDDQLVGETIAAKAADAAQRLFEYEQGLDEKLEDQPEEVVDIPEHEPKTMPLNERLTFIKRELKFTPHTHEELNRVIELTDDGLRLGAATHLARIQQRNVTLSKKAAEAKNTNLPDDKKVSFDPTIGRRTAEKIVGQYIGYAESALSQMRLLLNFQTMISNRYRRSEPASAVSILQDWTMDASTEVPIKALMKSREIEDYVIDDTDKKTPLQIDYSKLPRAEVRAQGDDYIRGLKVGQLQGEIAALAQEQKMRFDFWTNVLKESLPNSAARDSAIAALKKFKLF